MPSTTTGEPGALASAIERASSWKTRRCRAGRNVPSAQQAPPRSSMAVSKSHAPAAETEPPRAVGTTVPLTDGEDAAREAVCRLLPHYRQGRGLQDLEVPLRCPYNSHRTPQALTLLRHAGPLQASDSPEAEPLEGSLPPTEILSQTYPLRRPGLIPPPSRTSRQVSTVSGGVTNVLLRVAPPEGSGLPPVLVRVFGENTEQLIDREGELRRVLALNRFGFGAKVCNNLSGGGLSLTFRAPRQDLSRPNPPKCYRSLVFLIMGELKSSFPRVTVYWRS